MLGTIAGPRGRAPARREDRLQLDRRRDLRRVRRAGDRGSAPRGRSRRTARRSSRARSTSRPRTGSTARAHVVAAVRERLRAAAGSARRGGRRRDLPGPAARRAATPTIFGDGTQTRDYVYVGDVVAATLAAARARAAASTTSAPASRRRSLELYDAIQPRPAVDREPEFAPARLGELQRSVLDASLAERELGWRPRHSLDEGLAETWAWISST